MVAEIDGRRRSVERVTACGVRVRLSFQECYLYHQGRADRRTSTTAYYPRGSYFPPSSRYLIGIYYISIEVTQRWIYVQAYSHRGILAYTPLITLNPSQRLRIYYTMLYHNYFGACSLGGARQAFPKDAAAVSAHLESADKAQQILCRLLVNSYLGKFWPWETSKVVSHISQT